MIGRELATALVVLDWSLRGGAETSLPVSQWHVLVARFSGTADRPCAR